MITNSISLHDPADHIKTEQLAKSIRTSTSSTQKGSPFTTRREPSIAFNNPNLFRPKVAGKTVVLPSSWRDDDED